MPDHNPTNSPIIAAFRDRTPLSEKLFAEAREVFPSEIGRAHV